MTAAARGTLILLHRRRRDLSSGAFEDWAEGRARRLAGLRPALGFPAAAQVRQGSRLRSADIALRLSRSWVPATLMRLLHLLPPPSFRPFRDDAAWDLAEIMDWPDETAMAAALAAPAGAGALAELAADGAEKVRARAAIRAATKAPLVGGGRGAATLYAFRRRRGMTREALGARWLGAHGALVTGLAPAVGFSDYDQHLATGEEGEGPDAVAALYFPDFGRIAAAPFSPRAFIANLRLAHDEAAFIDAGRSAFIVGDVHPVG